MMQHHFSSLKTSFRIGAVILALFSAPVMAAVPITTDSRIKTLVFNENEVFSITTHYGYQCNIEFGPKETIETISVGDRIGWQISPAGRRLFIRAQEENAHTNMTVITNQRAYQFDLRSSNADAVFGSSELTYVVRFFYPDTSANTAVLTAAPVALALSSAPMPAATPAPMTPAVVTAPAPSMPVAASIAAPAPTPTVVEKIEAEKPAVKMAEPAEIEPAPVAVAAPVSAPAPSTAADTAFNYRYTFTGPDSIAPVKIFDDGSKTFFKFTHSEMPKIAALSSQGDMVDLVPSRTEDGLVSVSTIAPRFKITRAGQEVVVYNESTGAY